MEPRFQPEPYTLSSYPTWIKGFGALVIAAVIASLITAFPYLVAKRQLMIAKMATYNED